MILTDNQIRQAIAAGKIVIEPFDERQIQPASIDLRVGAEGATTKTKQKVDIKTRGFITLEPGDFGVILIMESIKFDNQHAGRIGLRSKFARKGLIATTGPQIDPGFHGSLILGLTNLTPQNVPIAYGDDILTLEIHRLEEPVAGTYSGPYQGRYGLGPEELEAVAESEGMALSEVLTILRSLTSNVGELSSNMKVISTKLENFQWIIPVITGVGIAIIAVIVAIK